MTSSDERPARRRGPRGDIRRADLVAAASRALDARGLAGVSTRAVAVEAGISPNSLYTYVDDMGDLLNAVGDAFLAGLVLDGLDGPDPRRALTDLLDDIVQRLDERPGVAQLLASRRIVGPASLALNEALLRCLQGAGIGPRRAADGVYALTAYLYGHLVCSVPDAADGPVGRALRSLDPADYPLTAATSESEGRLPGLDVVLDGLLG